MFITVQFLMEVLLEALQSDLDQWLCCCNSDRTPQGKMYCGRTPMQTLEEGKGIWKEQHLAQN